MCLLYVSFDMNQIQLGQGQAVVRREPGEQRLWMNNDL